MTLRVGFDMDGVLADFGSAFRDIECDLFGADTTGPPPNAPEEEKEQTPDRNLNPARQRERDATAVVAPSGTAFVQHQTSGRR